MTLTRNSSSPTVPWWEPGLTLPVKCSPNGPIPAKTPWAIRLRNDPRQPEYWVANTFGGMPVGGFSTGVGGAATAGLARAREPSATAPAARALRFMVDPFAWWRPQVGVGRVGVRTGLGTRRPPPV